MSSLDEISNVPYNINNKLITEKDIINILNKNNVQILKVNHLKYFIQAFVHKSYCKKDIYTNDILNIAKQSINNPNLLDLFDASYERLEYLGDRVLKLSISMYLFYRYPTQDEGFMTRLQTKLEDKSNLAALSRELGLHKYFIISKQIEVLNGRNLDKLHEDIFESFIGALYLSNGYEVCLLLITNLLETLIDYSAKLYYDNNYKDYLLRVYHQNKWEPPKYDMINTTNNDNKKIYIMGVQKNNIHTATPNEFKYIGYGYGSTKKEGEQKASKMALILLKQLNNDQFTIDDIYYPINQNLKIYSDISSNYKIELLKICSNNNWSAPSYTLISFDKINNEYIIGIKPFNHLIKIIDDEFISYGYEKTIYDAEENAAKMLLIILGYISNTNFDCSNINYNFNNNSRNNNNSNNNSVCNNSSNISNNNNSNNNNTNNNNNNDRNSTHASCINGTNNSTNNSTNNATNNATNNSTNNSTNAGTNVGANNSNNYIDILANFFIEQKWPLAKYVLLEHSITDNDTEIKYITGIEKNEYCKHIMEPYIAYGYGATKQISEIQAAKMALIIFGQLSKEHYTELDLFYPSLKIDEDAISEKSV